VFALIAGVFAFAYSTKKQPASGVTRFSFAPPFKTDFVQLAVSPDGRHVVFAASTANGSALWLRPLESLKAQQLSGTENGQAPFWSPDGRFIGFTAQG
jgi:Tol biopolymer transport system component